MTVKQLIEELEKLNPEAEASVFVVDDFGPVNAVGVITPGRGVARVGIIHDAWMLLLKSEPPYNPDSPKENETN